MLNLCHWPDCRRVATHNVNTMASAASSVTSVFEPRCDNHALGLPAFELLERLSLDRATQAHPSLAQEVTTTDTEAPHHAPTTTREEG